MTPLERSRLLVDNLLAGGQLPAADPGTTRLVETHLSWVILAGTGAWKIKKPVRLDFVDFSTLGRRHAACLEELRLNRRMAPGLYQDVVAITGSAQAPRLGGTGEPLEYAVRMSRFPDGAVLGEGALERLEGRHIDDLAARIAAFHDGLPPADPASILGRPTSVWDAAATSLDTLARVTRGVPGAAEAIEAARACAASRYTARRPLLESRRAAGRVRECHGDLHLGNLALLDDRVEAFDALEFDPALRWVDVLSEVAFLVMDLDLHGRRDLAFRFLNRYLDGTGDHEGLPVLPFFLAYRAIVRAKVRALAPGADSATARADLLRHLRYAAGPPGGVRPLLVLMSGISGSGKSWLAHQLAGLVPAVHLRSDVERRRLHGLEPGARTHLGPGEGIYAPAASDAVYARLRVLARAGLAAGLPVIVDATCLRRAHRSALARVARAERCKVAIVACRAVPGEIEARVTRRAAAGADPSEAGMAVVAVQRAEYEEPAPDEADCVCTVDTGGPVDPAALAATLRGAWGGDRP